MLASHPLVTDAIARDLQRLCPDGIARNVSLARISRWRIGGRADLILWPASTRQIAALRQYFHCHSLPHVVIGATSNLLFADEGLRVPCIQIGGRMSCVRIYGNTVEVEAGAWVPGFARCIMLAGLTGAEHICGIPGTLGGLICMNGGSQRKGIGSNLIEAVSIDATGTVIRRRAANCGFAYRQSIYQDNTEIITAARLHFDRAEDRSTVRRTMLAILAERRHKFPRKLPNCGSVFKSNPAMYESIGPPGAVIEQLGFKGRRIGGALVSPLHANFIVNVGDARAEDVLTLIAEIVDTVFRATGHRMEAEVRYITPSGDIHAAAD